MTGLQRDVNVVPTVASGGAPPPPRSDNSGAIQAIAGAVKTFSGNRKKSALEEELRSLGDEVFAATTGKQLEDTSKRFERLKKGQEQGVLTDTMVKIEAEAVLKEAIDTSPAYAPELRQHAARILGYDPTGTQIRALLDVPDTQVDKRRQQAEAIAIPLGLNVDDVIKLQAQQELAKTKADLLTSQAAIGAADRRDVFNATMEEADGYISDFMAEIVSQVKAGGVANPQEQMAVLEAHKMGHKQALRDRYSAIGVSPDSAELTRDMAAIDSQWESLQELASEGSLSTILADNAKTLGNALTIAGYDVMGDVAIHNKIGGQEAVKNYFKLTEKYGKKDQIDLLASQNPALTRMIEAQGGAVRAVAESYKRVMGVPAAFDVTSNLSPEEAAAMSDLDMRIFYDAAKSTSMSEEEKLRRLSFAQQQGQKYKVMGAYFQKGAKQNASAEEVKYVVETFEEEYPRIVSRLSAQIGQMEDVELVINKSGQLELIDLKKTQFTGHMQPQGSMFSAQIPIGEDVRIFPVGNSDLGVDLVRVNSFIKGVNNGWAADFKRSPATFASDVISDVRAGRSKDAERKDEINRAIQQFEANPTTDSLEALRKVDPELVTAIERAAAAEIGAASGGDNNAN